LKPIVLLLFNAGQIGHNLANKLAQLWVQIDYYELTTSIVFIVQFTTSSQSYIQTKCCGG